MGNSRPYPWVFGVGWNERDCPVVKLLLREEDFMYTKKEGGLYFPLLLSSGKNILFPLDFPFLVPLSPLGVTADGPSWSHDCTVLTLILQKKWRKKRRKIDLDIFSVPLYGKSPPCVL